MKSIKIILLPAILAIALVGIFIVKNKAKNLDPHAGHDHSVLAEVDEDAGHEDHVEGDEDAAHEDHADHVDDDAPACDDHADDDEEETAAIVLTDAQIKQIGIKVESAKKGKIEMSVNLPGEVAVNSDRMAHIVPRVSGIVMDVKKKLGDSVKAGEVMAIIQSGELADAKGAYLAAIERFDLAKTIFEREGNLREKKISSEQEYLDAKKVFAEGRIEKRSTEQKLLALGFSEEYLASLLSESEKLLTRFEITAPFDGTIIERHITLGEVVSDLTGVFIVADLSSVWVDLQIYQKYLTSVKRGQKVLITDDGTIGHIEGVISYVGHVVDAKSRTALARIVLPNTDGVLRPGIFVTAKVATDSTAAGVVVSKDAIQTVEGKKCIFIKDAHGFEIRFVVTGKSDAEKIEITSGLKEGEKYVSKGAFDLKAKVVTSTMDSHAGHGH